MKRILWVVLLVAVGFPAGAQDFEGTKKINGTLLYLKIKGTGEPLVIVHGGPGLNSSYLLPHLEKLSKKYRLVFYDQRASGKSPAPAPDSISLKFFADDLEGIRKELGVEKLNLLAHSWGVLPAVEYGILYPDRVNKMILVNPIPLNKSFDSVMLDNMKKKSTHADSTDRSIIIGSKGFRAGDSDAYRKLLLLTFRHSFYDPQNYARLTLDLQWNFAATNPALQKGLAKDMDTYDFYEPVKAFTFPVLVLHGFADAIPYDASNLIQHAIPKSRLEVYRKSGHFLFIEQNGKFLGDVYSFLSGQ